MKYSLQLKFLFVILILSIKLLSVKASEQLNGQESQPYVIFQSSLSLDHNLSYYTIPLDLDTLKGYQINGIQYQDDGQTINNELSSYFVGNIALEFQINSEQEFNIFLQTTNQQNATSLRRFKSMQGNNHLKINMSSDQQLEIILEKIQEKEADNNHDDDDDDDEDDDENQDLDEKIEVSKQGELKKNQTQIQKQFPAYLNYTLKVISLNQTKQYCPYNCYGNGECKEDDMCHCNDGFSPVFFCMIQVKDFKIDLDKITDFQIYGIQDNPKNNKPEEQLLKQQWNYAKLEINNFEDLKNQVLYKQQLYGIPNEILINFYYTKNVSDNQPGIKILDNHNYFKDLETEARLEDNKYSSTFQFINFDYYQFFEDQNTQGQLITFAYNKNFNSFQIEISVHYDDFKLLFESIQMLVIVLLCILLLIFLAIVLKKSDIQVSQIRQLSIRQINQLTYLKRSHQTNIDIQNIMNLQLTSFVYHLSSQKDLENGTHAECFICLNTYEEQDELCKTKCGHVFHKNCMQAWVSKNQVCPIDRNCIFDGKPICKEQICD
ncbi:hypothetical protein ABPG72_002990 [Tetrahymena utriculariae]